MDEVKWLNSAMPLLASLVLGIVGLILAFFASYFEGVPSRVRLRLLILCGIIGFWGFFVDLHQRSEAEKQTKTIVDDAEKILARTNGIATSVDETLDKVRTMPTKEELDAQIAAIQKQIPIAKKANDVRLANFLEQKKAALIRQR